MRRLLRYGILWWMLLPLPFAAEAQKELFKKMDSLSRIPPYLKRGNKDSIRREFYNQTTKITFPVYWKLLASDLKQQVTSPFYAKPRLWYRTAAVAGVTAGVLLLDVPISRNAVDWRKNSTTLVSTSKYITRFGGAYEVYTLAALGTYGWLFKNEKIKTTTLLATQAYITSAVIFEAAKFLSGRQRPYYYDPETNTNSPAWHGPFYQFRKDENGNRPDSYSYTSFPSGHTCLAFAAATVYAMEYSDRPLVKISAYTAASLIGLSRITENKHWASDVLIGGILGHLIGRQVVNNYHRYAKLKSEEAAKNRNTLTFAPQFQFGRWLPGVVYTFN
ncbi:phosphatase PAP2 family protein [Longitalea luteola]|uniref:phosphatase PAP2 family protein n=1 Tax=Longitalea luteola TaxID=2812563 RepID=UPI001A9678CA|nr:phosphatase PAP2 family protein [Longitalea luteola]